MYPEQLDITKNITIKGAACDGARRRPIIEPTSLTTSGDSDTDQHEHPAGL